MLACKPPCRELLPSKEQLLTWTAAPFWPHRTCMCHAKDLVCASWRQHCLRDPHTGVSPPAGSAATGVTPPGAQPAPPPADTAVRRSIDTLAPYVARNGPSFEALARERHANDPAFAFLRGGEGAAFYQQQVRCLLRAAAS